MGAIRESSGMAGHDSISVAISPVPEGQCLGTVVRRPHQERPRHSQAMIVALARKLLIALWRLVRDVWCQTASFCVPHNDRRT